MSTVSNLNFCPGSPNDFVKTRVQETGKCVVLGLGFLFELNKFKFSKEYFLYLV